jgi:medium-chain acyl-[acyl-carrier-protein] hydrolase
MFKSPQWLVCPVSKPQATVRLLCLPFAGGSHREFQPWASALPPWVELWSALLPGRAQRFLEPPFRALPALVGAIADQICLSSDLRPLALFGHSMGGLVAYELVRELTRRGGPRIGHLFASGAAAPHLPRLREWHQMPEEQLLSEIAALNCVPYEVLSHMELLRVMLPTLRADFQVLETYHHVPGPPVPCPITIFAGTADHLVDSRLLPEWNAHSADPCKIVVFEGDHFFIHQHASAMLREMSAALNPPIPTCTRQ